MIHFAGPAARGRVTRFFLPAVHAGIGARKTMRAQHTFNLINTCFSGDYDLTPEPGTLRWFERKALWLLKNRNLLMSGYGLKS